MDSKSLKTIYKCPVCGSCLIEQGKRYVCVKGHSFDISGKGYVNFLLANKKKTKDPGDSKEMMKSRKSFLDKGYYERLSDLVNKTISFYINSTSSYILDVGCGEGYYLSRLRDNLSTREGLSDINYYGIDISKSAIKYASSRDKDILFAIGSNFDLPIVEDSIDCATMIFAPGDDKEIYRVLKQTGVFIVVTPGIDHLFELKQKLYEKARKNDEKDSLINGFKCIDHMEIKYSIELKQNEDIKNLILMTPYFWSIAEDIKNEIHNINYLKTTLHFNINAYNKDI